MSGSYPRFVIEAALCLGVSLAQAQSPNPPSAGNAGAEGHPVLVELFTSEGCSSCPPADTLLEKLDSLQPIPGAHLIVLSEHVDYWDKYGWKDPNASAQLTDRQTSYERGFKRDAPYTPQMIVDGATEADLTNLPKLQEILKQAQTTTKIPVRIGEVSFRGDNPTIVELHVEADPSEDKHNADVYVAVALDHVESEVVRGENKGKHLTSVAVVEQLAKVGKVSKGKNFSQNVELKLKPGTNPKDIRLVAFVQESGPGKLLGATLSKPSS